MMRIRTLPKRASIFFRSLRRSVSACLLLLSSILCSVATAADYPSRAITIVVPWSAGGPADSATRVFAEYLGQAVGQPVIVENKPGAGGNIGTAAVARARPDGYTLLLATSSTNAIGPWLFKSLPFEPVKDFSPIALLTANSNILEVNPSSPFQSLQDVIDAARKNPGALTYGSGGIGSSQHLAGSMFSHQLGLDITHVPYNGGGPAGMALLAGQVSMVLDTGTIAHVKSGALRALAVAAKERLAVLPDVPTFAELDYPNMVTGAWYALVGPAGMPPEIVGYLNAKCIEVLSNEAVAGRLAASGAFVQAPYSPAELARFMNAELERYKTIVEQSGATAK